MEDKENCEESKSKKDSEENKEIVLIDADFIDTQSTDPIENIVDYD